MDFSTKPIAMTDLETSGDVFAIHEILEIGLVVFDQKTFEILDTLDIKVKPEHIETALPTAMEGNKYSEENWKEAVDLTEAIKKYARKTQDCIFCSYNVSFDWGFVCEAFRKTGIPNHLNNRANHDRIDLLTLAWAKGLRNSPSFGLKAACAMFGVPPEPWPHSALNGAMTEYELFKKIV